MKKQLNLLFGIALILLLGYAAVRIIFYGLHGFARLDKSVQAGTVTALAVIGVAAIGYFANKSIETRKAVEQAVRPKKLELYQEFITFFLRVLGKEGVIKKPSEKEMQKFYVDSTPLLITFASHDVIKRWGKLRLSMADDEGQKSLFELESLLKDIRRDLGHSNRGFHKGDILRLFVNDIDNYLK
jgi:hypothetical protein